MQIKQFWHHDDTVKKIIYTCLIKQYSINFFPAQIFPAKKTFNYFNPFITRGVL